VTPCVQYGTTQNLVASLLEMEQKGLDDTKNLLGLLHKLFLSYGALFFFCQKKPRLFFSWTLPLALLQSLLKSTPGSQYCLRAIKQHITLATNGAGDKSNL